MGHEMTIKANPALASLSAVDAQGRIARGEITAREYLEAHITVIEAREPEVHAFAWFDADHARAQADQLDTYRRSGRAVGPLHGLPVALKDVIDTVRILTENGCAADQGRVPTADAWIVQALKAAGAVIIGKTVTTELAFMHSGPTTNPHNAAHTPGGSSSGSAAAVAAGMTPLAIGTQTGGSVIRPAAFCGVTGFKPTFGTIPRTGVLSQSPSLDTIGVFARDVADAALLADAICGHDPADAATSPAPPPRLLATATEAPPLDPVFAFVAPPGWDEHATDETKAAFAELTEALGEKAFDVPLPEPFNSAEALRRRINLAEMAKTYHRYTRAVDTLGAATRDALEDGAAITAKDYLAALDWQAVLYAAAEEVFEHCDVILCPAAPGPAPEGLASTGNAIFNGLWTFLGTPAITLPLFEAENGLPMGVQLVGPRGNDARLLRSARWLQDLAAAAQVEETT